MWRRPSTTVKLSTTACMQHGDAPLVPVLPCCAARSGVSPRREGGERPCQLPALSSVQRRAMGSPSAARDAWVPHPLTYGPRPSPPRLGSGQNGWRPPRGVAMGQGPSTATSVMASRQCVVFLGGALVELRNKNAPSAQPPALAPAPAQGVDRGVVGRLAAGI